LILLATVLTLAGSARLAAAATPKKERSHSQMRRGRRVDVPRRRSRTEVIGAKAVRTRTRRHTHASGDGFATDLTFDSLRPVSHDPQPLLRRSENGAAPLPCYLLYCSLLL
jgi:hypothetical protein